jgi:hypothetical protein
MAGIDMTGDHHTCLRRCQPDAKQRHVTKAIGKPTHTMCTNTPSKKAALLGTSFPDAAHKIACIGLDPLLGQCVAK